MLMCAATSFLLLMGTSSHLYSSPSNPASSLPVKVEVGQLLRVLNSSGKTIYRVQLPKEGKVIFLGERETLSRYGCPLHAIDPNLAARLLLAALWRIECGRGK